MDSVFIFNLEDHGGRWSDKINLKESMRMWTGFIWLRIGSSGRLL
jgi:hypothetical protein